MRNEVESRFGYLFDMLLMRTHKLYFWAEIRGTNNPVALFLLWGAQWLSGRVLDLRLRGRWFITSLASLCCGPWARHIYPSLLLVEPRKTRSCLTERLLMERKESNKQFKLFLLCNTSLKIRGELTNIPPLFSVLKFPQPFMPAICSSAHQTRICNGSKHYEPWLDWAVWSGSIFSAI